MTSIREYNFSDLYEMGSGISSKPEQAGHGSPFVSFSTVFNNFFLPDKLNDLMNTSEREQEIYSVKAGDILLTRTSETIDELGMSCVVLKDYPKATFSGFVKRLRPTQENIIYPQYMGFYLRSKFFRKTMTNNAVLTLRASLNEDIFSYLKLYLPDYPTQKRIGDFLYSLNQKISLNNRINAELEAMAKIIYDYWFVQFDFPISKGQAKAMGKPKLEGKPYKASGGKMVWSEELKREVPEGWDIGSLADIANIKMGQSPPGESYNETGNGTVFFQGSTDFGSRFPTTRQFTTLPSRMAEQGDILLSVRAPVGTMNIAKVECCIGRGLAALNSKDNCMAYLHGVMRNLHQIFERRNTDGTTFGAITKDDLFSLKVLRPSKTVLEKFNDITKPMFDQQNVMADENQKLSELRDWLLPMLMNGQVKIKETIQSRVAAAVSLQSKPPNSYFYQTQLVAAIINASNKHKITHGEMTLAKYTYLVDKIYGVPTYFNYERLHLGPYPKEMKKIVNNRKFFKIQNNEVSVVAQKKEYNFEFQQQMENAIAELASLFSQYNGKKRSHQTELLATVCKVVEDIKSADLRAVRESMKNWPIDLKTSKFKNKAEKFSEEETRFTLNILVKRNWHTLLTAS
jgi:type I restriction enzyme, S subunit